MFEVVRWPGPGDGGDKRSEGALTLHQLNARARERAEARRRGQAANGNGNAHTTVAVKSRLGIDSQADADAEAENGWRESKKERKKKKKEKAEAAVEMMEEVEPVIPIADEKEERRKIEESESVILISDKKENKREKKRKIVEMKPVSHILEKEEKKREIEEMEPVIHILDKKEKKRKKRKFSSPTQVDEDVIGEGHVEVGVAIVKGKPDVDEISSPLKKKKKKERKKGVPESEAQVDSLENVGKRVSNVEVSGSLLPASLNAAVSLDSKFRDVSEKPDVVAAVQAGKEEKKKKRKRVRSDTEEPDVDSAAQTVREEKEKKTKIVRSAMEEPDVVAAVQIIKVKKKKEGKGVRNETEKPDVAVAVETNNVKRKKQSKRVSDDDEAPDKKAESVNDPPSDSRVEFTSEKTGKVPADEVDLSKIERDVEKILGHDLLPSKSAAGTAGKGPAVLPWMREPMEISSYKSLPLDQVPLFDVRLQDALRKTGIKALFPVQVAVWHETVGPGLCDRDLCVSSPTGSGKTLSYALPIVQKLSTRVICRLRALIVLPTRDLASQVKAVFDTIAPAVGLRVGLAVGQTSIVAEAAQLVKFRRQMAHSFGGSDTLDQETAESRIDILVATPGRLMDHLHNTKEFTLEHLVYLVVDETDRLLRQSYQEWLPNVLSAVAAIETRKSPLITIGSVLKGSLPSVHTIRHQGMERGLRSRTFPRMMKMVLSATLTRDPSKIAQLALHCPMYIAQSAVENRYQLPEHLEAFKLVCKAGEKPLYLVALLQQLAEQQTIVFTASVVATHRLFTLLGFFAGLSFKVVEYSSLQHQQARSKALAKFRNREVQVLVASDAMTRGMDVEGVENVVNYDMPVYAKTYVHRVGRTARAGRAGCSYTLLRKEEVRHFKSLLKKADNSSCKDYKLPALATEYLYEPYVEALEKLKQVTKEESGVVQAPTSRSVLVHALDGEQGGSGADGLFL